MLLGDKQEIKETLRSALLEIENRLVINGLLKQYRES
jgi:hypothetical protein